MNKNVNKITLIKLCVHFTLKVATTNLFSGYINECFKDQQSSFSFLLFLSPMRDLCNQGNMPMDNN